MILLALSLWRPGGLPADTTLPDVGHQTRKAATCSRFLLKFVFDGDSLKLSGAGRTVHIRIVGIDAPERGSQKHRTPGQPYGKKAADHLKRLLAKRYICIKGYGTDAYHRQLAELFVDGRNIGLAMVAAGYAEVYAGRPPEGLDLGPYRAAERHARQYRRGMWAQGRRYVSPRQWRAAHPR